MIAAPHSCWRSWLSPAQEFDISYRPLQALRPVIFDSNPLPRLGRARCRRRHAARRSSPVHYCQGSESIWIELT